MFPWDLLGPNGVWGGIQRGSDGFQWDFGVPLGSQWIPMGFIGVLRDPNGSQWGLLRSQRIPMDSDRILGFLRDPNGLQWDFGVPL